MKGSKKPPAEKRSEVDVARPVVEWLRSRGFDVYQEVKVPKERATADIVAVKGPVTTVVEVKTSMSLVVLGQARGWGGLAHMVYVAVPSGKRGSSRDGAEWVCNLAGVGLLYVSRSGTVRQAVSPAFVRKARTSLIRGLLRPEQADGSVPAGSRNLGVWTPWKETVRDLVRVATERPGIALDEAVGLIRHHYKSPSVARRTLEKQLRRRILKGLRYEADGKRTRVFPTA